MLRTGTVSSFVYRSHLDQGVSFKEQNGSFRVDRGLLCIAVPLFEEAESLAHGERRVRPQCYLRLRHRAVVVPEQ